MLKTIKIVHICHDEKFINSAIQQFESCFPYRNKFYIVSPQESTGFIHVKPEKSVVTCTAQNLLDIAKSMDPDVLVIVHSLSPQFYDFVLQLPKINKVVWFCFGFEVYNDENYFKTDHLLDPITKEIFPKVEISQSKRVKELTRPYYRLLNKDLPLSPREIKKAVIKRINFLGSSFQEEFYLICKLIRQKKTFFAFWYYPLEQIIDVSAPVNTKKKNLLIGNSGSYSGNHLDVFYKIKVYNLNLEHIVTPLSYGDKNYIDIVVKEGNQGFSDKFKPLLQFMPLLEYNNILKDVGVAIFNNCRQQAVGNTIALLWMGAKVFLNRQNPFYAFLIRHHIYVYCYETELNEHSCNELLTLKQITHNRNILHELLNKKKLGEALQNQIYSMYAE